jgi:hypothetical protein
MPSWPGRWAGLLEGLAVVGSGWLVQLAFVAGLAVKQVMDALGDGRELLVALQYHPARVDARPCLVAEQEVHHLGDAAALLG